MLVLVQRQSKRQRLIRLSLIQDDSVAWIQFNCKTHLTCRVLTKDQLYTCHNVVPLPAVVAI